MRKIIFIIILLSLINIKTSAINMEADELIMLADLLTESDIKIEEWQVTLKEKVTKERVNSIINQMNNDNSVKTIKDQNMTKYVLMNTHNEDNLSVSYNMIIPKNKKYAAELVAIIEGEAWTESVLKNYEKILIQTRQQYFTEKANKFTCLTSSNNAIIKSVYFFNLIKQQMNLQYISTQTDTINEKIHKKMIYGYTTLWNEKIINNDMPMNLQIVIKQLQSKESKITIGTPLLINEY